MDGIQRLGPFFRIGGVHVEEEGVSIHPQDFVPDGLRVGQGLLAVEMNADDVHAVPGKGLGRRSAESAGGSENQGP